MTIIICELRECIFNDRANGRCKCTAIGVEKRSDSNLPYCDSYFKTPKQLEDILIKTDSKASDARRE